MSSTPSSHPIPSRRGKPPAGHASWAAYMKWWRTTDPGKAQMKTDRQVRSARLKAFKTLADKYWPEYETLFAAELKRQRMIDAADG
jgi:hypothetical protein